MRSVSILMLMLMLAGSGGAQQPAPTPSPSQDPYHIRVERQLVLVDVVVRGRRGQPLPQLTAADFILTEDGQAQEIAFFTPGAALIASTQPGEGGDSPVAGGVPVEAPPVVVLLDAINSKPEDRVHARRALAQILERLQPGQRVAIYGLGRELVLLHGFSSDAVSLLRALERYHRESPSKPKAELHAADDLELVAEAGVENLGPAIEAMRRFEAQIEADLLRFRGEITAAALRSIAQSLRSQPGRKALVWLSGSFPSISVEAPRLGAETTGTTVNLEGAMRAAAAALSDAQIAVYPVHTGGLPALPDLNIARPARRDPTARMSEYRIPHVEHQGGIDTIRLLAERTGGTAFYNRNDLTLAYTAALEDSASYYTLAYYPSNRVWNGQFRRIRVSTSQRGLSLLHRQGYFALGPEQRRSRQYSEQEVSDALFVNPAQLDEVGFHVLLLPPVRDEQGAEWGMVNFVIPGSSLPASPGSEDNRVLEFAAALFDRNGRIVTNSSRSVNVNLRGRDLQRARIEHQLPLERVPGSGQRVRALVRDAATGLIGTMDIFVP